MKVLSLFNGLGGVWIALDKLDIKVTKRYSSETDKYANIVNDANYSDTIQLGDIRNIDVSKLDIIDLIVGGSPCQGFSFAGKQLNFNDPRSALFFEFVRVLNDVKKINPDVKFLLENVNMKKKHMVVISQYLGVLPVNINSNLVSAQNRDRWYWTNIRTRKEGFFDEIWSDIPQPEDKGILLKDILQPEDEIDKKYYLSTTSLKRLLKENPKINPDKSYSVTPNSNTTSGGRSRQGTYIKLDKQGNKKANQNKAGCLTGGGHSGGGHSGGNHSDMDIILIPEATKKGYTEISPGECVDLENPKSKTRKGRKMKEKSNCMMSAANHFHKYTEDFKLRRLTPIECERLQTIPDNYTYHVSDTQQYRMLGNGFTSDVIAHILSYL